MGCNGKTTPRPISVFSISPKTSIETEHENTTMKRKKGKDGLNTTNDKILFLEVVSLQEDCPLQNATTGALKCRQELIRRKKLHEIWVVVPHIFCFHPRSLGK